LIAFVGLSCFAASNSLQTAILSFPEVAAYKYRPDVAADGANVLIGAGRDDACAALAGVVTEQQKRLRAHIGFDQELSEDTDRINRKVCYLCRLIFTPSNSSQPLRPPRLGALSGMPYESLKPPDWSDIPFVIINDIPLSMSLGYAGAGRPESAENYLAYCKANGSFRTKLLIKASSITASNALNQVFNSPAWKALKWKDEGLGWDYSLKEDYVKERLWKQVYNMANQTEQQPGTGRSAQETNQTSSPGFRRLHFRPVPSRSSDAAGIHL